MSRQLYLWMLLAVLVGLAFGVVGIYVLVRYLTRPVARLMECISRGSAGLNEFETSNILEVDALFDVVKALTDRQKEAENILLEEKERYRVALESSRDIFFSYDIQNQMLDLVNHKTMNGRWQCGEYGDSFINPEDIYEMDREDTIAAMREPTDKLFMEFRLRWPKEGAYKWGRSRETRFMIQTAKSGSWWVAFGIFRSRKKEKPGSCGKTRQTV